MKKSILAVGAWSITSLLITSFAWGQQESPTIRIHNFYKSTRAMGMGNAYSAVADDYATMLYNPSLLVYRKNSEFQINLVSAGFATKTSTLITDVQETSDATYPNDSEKEKAISNVLEQYYGKPLGLRVSPMEFIWVSPRWGLSLIVADVTADMLIQRQVGPALDLHAIKDTSLSYAYAWSLGDTTSLGVLGKFVHRNEMYGQYTAMDLALDSKIIDFKQSREGMNFDIDLAFSWKPNFTRTTQTVVTSVKNVDTHKPAIETRKQKRQVAQEKPESAPAATEEVSTSSETTVTTTETTVETKTSEVTDAQAEKNKKDIDQIDTKTDGVQIETKKAEVKETYETYQPLTLSAVLRNVISMDYNKSTMVNKDATQVPDNNERVLDLGAGYSLYDGTATDIVVAVEAKNIMHPQASLYKSSHLGLELTWAPFSWLSTQFRAGMNQMYFTGGFGLVMGPLDIEFATYGEEFGTDKSRSENRVYAATVGLKF